MAEFYLGPVEWPVDPVEWEKRAREKLDPAVYDYIAGGAGAETTVDANREAFRRWRLVPRMLGSAPERDLSVEILGVRHPAPLFFGPVGGIQRLCDPEGELAVGRAAEELGLPLVLSTAASRSLEEVAAVMPRTPRWFQLYWVSDREVVKSLLDRAAASGYQAIVVTLDTLTLAWRDRDLSNGYLPFLKGHGTAQFTSDPVFRAKLGFDPEGKDLQAGAAMLAIQPNMGLRWEDFGWLREQTSLPILVKGVLAPADAQRAFEIGLDGVIVSNHGGRQVDGAIAALDALVAVREAVGADRLLLMDSGIRRGADVVKALALGARAVLIGRPFVYGLAVGGVEGVQQVMRNLLADTESTLGLCGYRSLPELGPEAVTRI